MTGADAPKPEIPSCTTVPLVSATSTVAAPQAPAWVATSTPWSCVHVDGGRTRASGPIGKTQSPPFGTLTLAASCSNCCAVFPLGRTTPDFCTLAISRSTSASDGAPLAGLYFAAAGSASTRFILPETSRAPLATRGALLSDAPSAAV